MLTQLAGVVLAEAAKEEPWPLIAPPFVIGGTLFVALMILMCICVAFMNMGNRHEAVNTVDDPHKQHTAKHGHHDDAASSHH